MPTTDAVNTRGELAYEYPELTVKLGPSGGAVPSTVFEDVYCARIVQSAGGSRLDYAELIWSLSESLQNRVQPTSFSRMVSVHIPDGSETRVHLGDYIREAYRIEQAGESLNAQSQLRPYHFGTPVIGYDIRDAISGVDKVIVDDIVFNPTIDDKTMDNMSSQIRNGYVGKLWTHPEVCKTDASEAYNGQTSAEWTLPRAVQAMCELLNPTEEFIRNPTYAQITAVDGMSTAADIRNVRISIGTRLHQALDALLIPNGYNWYVDYDTATSKPIITLFRIGKGTEQEVYLQPPGESLNLEVSNTNQLSIDNAIGESFNQVRVLGEFEEAEVTIPLYPTWDESDDVLTASSLSKQQSTYSTKETVHRLWTANESADQDPNVTRWGITPDVLNLSTVFTLWVPHRRTIGEPLTYQGGIDTLGVAANQRRPIWIEYSIDAGVTWQAAKSEWSIKLCPNQIGIMFDADEPPSDLINAGNDARVRITGTLFGDSRVQGLATKQSYSANGRTFEHVLNVPEKFQKRWRQATGEYKSVLITDDTNTNGADETDDTASILTYAEAIRDQNHHAEIDCEFRLPGYHLEYKIGDLITKVNGRELSLDSATDTAPASRYVQITERRWEVSLTGGPSTVLIVDRGIDQAAPDRSAADWKAFRRAERFGGT